MTLRPHILLLCAALSTGGCAGPPEPPAPAADAIVTARLGSTARAGGVQITPLRVIEDSRCPADAMCVQQGRARVLARIASGGTSAEIEMILGGAPTRLGRRIDLVAVCPYPLASQPAAAGDRSFVFSVSASNTPPAEGPDYCA